MRVRRRVLALAVAMAAACGGSGTDESTVNGGGEAIAESASAAGPEMIVLTVPDMSCPLCSRSIEARLTDAGLRDIRIDLETKQVTGTFDPSRITPTEVKALVEGQGFPVTESRRVAGPQLELEP